MNFEMQGLSELMSQLSSLENGLENMKDQALKEGAKVMQEETERAARVRTGNLKRNIKISEIEDGSIYVYVDNQGKAYYGQMLEFGTSKMSAKPFMAPAFNQSKMQINQAMANKLRQYLSTQS